VLAGDDWLITRVNGLWTWERSGPEGRVHKRFLNQEVLRLGPKGEVEVVSLQAVQPGKTIGCADRARHDAQDACSSAFLDCKPAGAGAFSALLGYLTKGSQGITDARNAYRCSINEDAVLQAALEVGLIDVFPPKVLENSAGSASASIGTPTPNINSPYWP